MYRLREKQQQQQKNLETTTFPGPSSVNSKTQKIEKKQITGANTAFKRS